MWNGFIRIVVNLRARNVINWFIAIFIALAPAMNGMVSPINSLSLNEFLLTLFLPVTLFCSCASRSHMFQVKPNYFLLFFFLMIVLFLPMSKEGSFVSSAVNISLLIILVVSYYSNYYRNRVVQAVVFFSVLASFLVIIQYIGFFIFGEHISYIPYVFYKDSVFNAYELLMTTGLDNSFFRPSSFFLEPSAMSRYCLLGLFCVMYDFSLVRFKKFLLLIITAGILMTTSGMGIVFATFLWFSYYLKKILSSDIEHAVRTFIIGSLMVALVVILYNYFEPLSSALSRINGEGLDGYNAIDGRFGNMSYFSGRSFSDWLIGSGMNSEPQVYFTGFMTIIYRWGLLGFVFFALSLFDCLIHRSDKSIDQWCLPFLILFFFITSGVFTAPNMVLFFILLYRLPNIVTMKKMR